MGSSTIGRSYPRTQTSVKVNDNPFGSAIQTTRSDGRQGKLQILGGNDGTARGCHKREEEIAAEHARCEAEIMAERGAWEREVKLQMEAMQAHMERLMKVVEDSKATSAAKTVGELNGVKLVPLSKKDDIKAYFEQIMKAHKVGKERWAHYLAPQLTGRAQLAFAADSGKYNSIKAAILQRYNINEEAYRRRFCTTMRGAGETNWEYAVKLMDLQRKWLKEHTTTVEQMQEALGLEQFLNSLPTEKRVWV